MKLATDIFAVIIALAGFAVSYTTQALLASQHGFLSWEAWLWPGIADAAALAMILRLHFGLVRPGWYTVEAWAVFALAAAIMVAANVIADVRDPLNGAMHGVVPIVAMAVWHVVIHGRPASMRTIVRGTRTATVSPAVSATRQPPTRTPSARVGRLLANEPDISAGQAARQLGVSRSTAARWLTEVRRPHVVEGS